MLAPSQIGMNYLTSRSELEFQKYFCVFVRFGARRTSLRSHCCNPRPAMSRHSFTAAIPLAPGPKYDNRLQASVPSAPRNLMVLTSQEVLSKPLAFW